MKPKRISWARLRYLLRYDPQYGDWFWLAPTSNRVKAGTLAGSPHASGYWVIRVDRRIYMAHVLAWFYMTGEWPDFEIDHKDMRRRNCAWSNLRPATHSLNGANRGIPKHNTSGFKGVSFYRPTGRWRASIRVDGREKNLGYHDTPEIAATAYKNAAVAAFGEFARVA